MRISKVITNLKTRHTHQYIHPSIHLSTLNLIIPKPVIPGVCQIQTNHANPEPISHYHCHRQPQTTQEQPRLKIQSNQPTTHPYPYPTDDEKPELHIHSPPQTFQPLLLTQLANPAHMIGLKADLKLLIA